jgi:hypothetical protein
MSKAAKIPAIVSMRNHFTPADELVENALTRLPDQFKHPDFRAWLVRYTENVIRGVASHFGIAAQRGIEQTAALLCDPTFYERRRRNRAEQSRKWKELQAKQRWENNERLLAPTAEQIQEQIAWHESQLKYHQAHAESAEVSLARLRKQQPQVIRPGSRILQ